MIRVVIADDHAVVRTGLAQLVDTFEGVELVGAATNGEEAVALVHERAPDVVLMDLEMPVLDGIEATRRIKGERPEVAVVVLTSFSDRERILGALDAGAVGLSTSFIDVDENLKPVPSRFAHKSELDALGSVLGERGNFAAQAFCVVALCLWGIAAAGQWRIPVTDEWGAVARRIYLRVEDGHLILTRAIVPIIGVGACGGALMVFITTMIQRSVPKRFHGRLFALEGLCYFTALSMATGLGAVLQQAVKAGRLDLEALSGWLVALALLVALGIVAATEWLRFKWMRRVAWLILKVWCRVEIVGRENVPRRGALIVAANHSSWIDTVLIAMAVPRVVHYLTVAQMYNYWLFRPFMRMFGAIPIPESGGAAGVLKTSIDILKRGRAFGIFPEGQLSPDGRIGRAREGIGLVAQRAGAPILPVALIGAFDALPRHGRVLRPRKIRVHIGTLIDPTGKDREQITAETMIAIARMLGQTYPPEDTGTSEPARPPEATA